MPSTRAPWSFCIKRLLAGLSALLVLAQPTIIPAQTGPPLAGPVRHVMISATLERQSDATTFGVGRGAGGIHPRTTTRGSRRTSTFFLLVADGREGRIAVGQSVPHVQWFYQYSRRHGYLVGAAAFRTVSTGFRVIPTIIPPDRIRLQVVPEISYVTDQGQGQIAFVESRLDVVVGNGQSVTVAANRHETESVLFNILHGYEAQNSLATLVMTLTPEIR
ncbi:MAG: hypothetical protein ACE5IQ_14885 [Candidatus Methylomirabilales bacterium]